MKDQYHREINYMRISVTQECNLKCVYCFTEEGCTTEEAVLSLENILFVCKQAVKLGITNFKITGGEPLLRKDIAEIIHGIKEIPGVTSVTLTTNGLLLEQKLEELVLAGLDAVNISLDTLQKRRYEELTKVNCLDRVLNAILLSKEYIPTKINVVLLTGINEEEWMDFIAYGIRQKVDVRFIELMPIGGGKNEHSVENAKILRKMMDLYPDMESVEEGFKEHPKNFKDMNDEELNSANMNDKDMNDEDMNDEDMNDEDMNDEDMNDEDMNDEDMNDKDMNDENINDKNMNNENICRKGTTKKQEMKQRSRVSGKNRQDPRNGPAVYYRIPGSKSYVGFISAVHDRFCGGCNRIRLTARGELKGCLCFEKQENIREILTDSNLTQEQKEASITQKLKKVIYEKPKMHHFENIAMITESGSMKEIGG